MLIAGVEIFSPLDCGFIFGLFISLVMNLLTLAKLMRLI